jgi:hypothetical protein
VAAGQDGGDVELPSPPARTTVADGSRGGVIELDADALLDGVGLVGPPPPPAPAAVVSTASIGGLLVVSDPGVETRRPRWRERRAARRLQARRVGRIVRHVDPWSVLKVTLLLNLCAFVVITLAGVMLWSVAMNLGVISDVEDFIRSAFALQSFAFDGDLIFRMAVLVGLALVVVGILLAVLAAVVFNLVSDLVGGIRLTVVEEESIRAAPPRGR